MVDQVPDGRGDCLKYHFSTAQCFETCRYKYKLTYLDDLHTLPSDDPQNPLILGTAIHKGMETDLQTAVREYLNSYPVIDDRHINEVIKMEHWIPRMKDLIPEGHHEVPFTNDFYMGTADLLVPVDDGYDLYDFKYSNNIDHYMESEQLHVYKYYLEQITGVPIRKMYFVFVPKVQIRQGLKEDIQHFRRRLKNELEQVDIQIREVTYDHRKVDHFHQTCIRIGLCTDFERSHTYLCDWCNYKEYCKKGNDFMILPSNERRDIKQIQKKKIWIFGDSFTGKTTVCDSAPDPLNLNTDGNIEFVSMPFVKIADQVTVEGRQTKTVFGWEVLKDAITELQKTAGSNGFKTIIIDLVEDAYEMCRLYMYNKLGIEHESDDAFRAWDKVRMEFLSTMREFFNLPYENLVIISKEDKSRDITRKSGDKITQIKPNLQDKVSVKLAGMVDIVVRAVVEDDGSHTLNFKTSEVVFGGGRLKDIKKTTIPCDWSALMGVYDTENSDSGQVSEQVEEPAKEEEKPVRRRRNKSEVADVDTGTGAIVGDPDPEPEPEPEDKPVRRRRRRKEE